MGESGKTVICTQAWQDTFGTAHDPGTEHDSGITERSSPRLDATVDVTLHSRSPRLEKTSCSAARRYLSGTGWNLCTKSDSAKWWRPAYGTHLARFSGRRPWQKWKNIASFGKTHPDPFSPMRYKNTPILGMVGPCTITATLGILLDSATRRV